MNRVATSSPNGRSLAVVGSGATLALLADPHSPSAEAYRSLAANLQFAYADRQLQSIGITSTTEGEGKSTTVANLAVALAQSGRRVIVIDADLRRPGQHTLFGVSRDRGLTDVLLREEAQLPLQNTSVPGVRVLASGASPGNPIEVLGSRRFDQALALARAEADFVLVDTPPAGALADVAVIAPRLEGVLLVVSAGKTKRDLARRAREQLERVNANILGVVLTDARVDSKMYRY